MNVENRSDLDQVKSGFIRALMWLLGMAWGALVVGGIGLVSGRSNYRPFVGWILLFVAALTLVATMDRWRKVIAGLLAYGAVNSLATVFSGHVTNNPSVHISKPHAIAATLFLFVSAALCYRFMEQKLSLLDRIALFTLVAAIFVQAAVPKLEAISLGIAMGFLVVAWIWDIRRHDSAHQSN